jgi:hypothetical protein
LKYNSFAGIYHICILQVLLATTCLLAVVSALPRPDGPAPAGYAPEEPSAPAAYTYNWAVKDDYTNNNYGQEETRDGYATSGAYYVLLPDGRTQKVSYSVNGDGGYVAEVSYEGEAKPYVAPAPKPYAPAPAPATY